jgi:hypothetical protein
MPLLTTVRRDVALYSAVADDYIAADNVKNPDFLLNALALPKSGSATVGCQP